MVQVDEGPWETCAPSAATPGLYTAPWAPALLDDTSGRPDHLLKAENKRNDDLLGNAWRQKWAIEVLNDLRKNRIAKAIFKKKLYYKFF